MIKKIILTLMIFNFTSILSANYHELAYSFKFKGINGKEINLNDYEGKVMIIVNVAADVDIPQYADLQTLWSNYKKDLVVIGVPTNNFKQEPKNNAEIKKFCETNFNIDFPLTEKIDVIGSNAHPF